MEEIYKQVAQELNLPIEVVKTAYESFFGFIREKISALPLREELTKEEFESLKTNFNIPSLGKLHCTYDRYIGMKKRYELIKQIKEKKNECKED